MTKFRSMVLNADKVGPTSTSGRDPRITPVGHLIRGAKLDEFTQLWNVFFGEMSLVGPRPQVQSHVDTCYTLEEFGLLNVKPGITDIASIVFSDEGEILKDSTDADYDYNRLIRPWKSRLGLLYAEKHTWWLDIKLIYLTVLAIFDKQKALVGVNKILVSMGCDDKIIEVCRRESKLLPYAPPGTDKVYEKA
jgi:lipopolysaccharide/colanic/teichoic acid biosynthesis glycosyltransferase